MLGKHVIELSARPNSVITETGISKLSNLQKITVCKEDYTEEFLQRLVSKGLDCTFYDEYSCPLDIW